MKQVCLFLLACWGAVLVTCAQEPAAPSKKLEIQQMPEFLDERLKELDAYKRNLLFVPISTQKPELQAFESVIKRIEVATVEISESESEMPGRARKRRVVQGPTPLDSRIEVRDFPLDTPWRAAYFYNVESVGLVIERSVLTEVSDSFYQVDLSRTLAQQYQLCPEEPYGTQPVLGLGTCFVRDSVTMITAAHVLEGALRQYAVVFDYEMVLKSGFVNPFIRKDNVFFPEKIPWRSEELDLAVFQLDRRCNRSALRFAALGNIKVDDDVYMIGHPSGLPKKAAFNAEITDASHPQYFYTSLDAFQGNSGSPVFSLKTHEVIGVLVSGGADFQWRGACNVSNVCRAPYCAGERVVRILLE
jgi:S1-C subfamily serine protease